MENCGGKSIVLLAIRQNEPENLLLYGMLFKYLIGACVHMWFSIYKIGHTQKRSDAKAEDCKSILQIQITKCHHARDQYCHTTYLPLKQIEKKMRATNYIDLIEKRRK